MSGPKKSNVLKRNNIHVYLSLVLIFIGIYLVYKQIFHEFSHLAVCVLSGNSGELFFGFPAMVKCPGILNTSLPVYFLYTMIPYLFLAFPVVLIFSLKTIRTDNLYVATILYSVPAAALMDTIDNFLFFFVGNNDFYNLLAVDRNLFILGGAVAVAIFSVSIVWIQKYFDLFKGILEKPLDRPLPACQMRAKNS